MNATELTMNLGKTGTINESGLTINIRITDAKVSYGTLRYLVKPLSGCGSIWVNYNRVTFNPSLDHPEIEPESFDLSGNRI